MIYPHTYLAWDLETSGLDPVKCRILEIGATKVVRGEITERRSWLLNHGIDIPEEITRITTIDKALIDADGVDPKVAVAEFLVWLGDANWVNLTHNGFRFDIPFLHEEIFRQGLHTIGDMNDMKLKLYKHGVDTAVLYKARELKMDRVWNENFAEFGRRVLDTKAFGVKYNVKHCCDTLGIDHNSITMHRALGDIFLTNEIYKKLTQPAT